MTVIERQDSLCDVLRRYGGSPLSYMSTGRGNRHWFSPDGTVVVAYRLAGSVALTVGDPIGPAADLSGAVDGFARYCRRNGWTPCLYGVGAGFSRTLATRCAPPGRTCPMAVVA